MMVLNMATLRDRFGRKLRVLRKEAGLSQERLAEKAEVSVDFLSLVERGVNAPSFETMERLAEALGKEVREFFNFEDGPEFLFQADAIFSSLFFDVTLQ